MRDMTEKLQTCFQTEGDVLVFPGAGTGGLEAAVVNLFSPRDKVIALTAGAFGERFAEIAGRFGLDGCVWSLHGANLSIFRACNRPWQKTQA